MAALKTKVKSLLTRQKEKSVDGLFDSQLPTTVELSPVHQDEKVDEIISSIDDVYFKEEEIDAAGYELKNLGSGEINMEQLVEKILQLKKEDGALYKKIYDLVFANYTAYVQELENVTALQTALQDATRTCVNARRQLRMAREGVANGGLGLLAKQRRRKRYQVLIQILNTFKTLQKAEVTLKEFLKEGDYPKATRICIRCQEAIETYKQFVCVSQLAVSLQDTQVLIENELEEALGRVPLEFDGAKYRQVQDAYTILGKTQRANDILLMKFTTSIHDVAYNIVAKHVQSSNDVKLPFQNLCKSIDADNFIECLLELCKVFWIIMCNYESVRQWHLEYDRSVSPTSLINSDNYLLEATEISISEITFHRNYIKQKLDHNLVRTWRDVQQKVCPYLEGCDMSHFQYDNFIKVLNIVSRLISIGTEFCGEGSDKLQESMRKQSLNYFRYYHRARLDELRLFLENEQWVACPIRSNFTVDLLREFRFMRRGGLTTPTSPLTTWKTGQTIFNKYTVNENPFEEVLEEEETEEVVMETGGEVDEDTVSSDDEKKNTVKMGSDDKPLPKLTSNYSRLRSVSVKGPVLANVTLTVVRFCGNYMQMMSVLRPIAYDVVQCLTHLFDYYLYAVYTFFAQDMIGGDEFQLSAKLSTSLSRISDTLLSSVQDTISSPEDSLKVPHPVANPFLQLDNSASLYGLSFRIVAIESLVFLADQFQYLLPHLKKLIPESKRNFLMQFFSQTVSPCNQLRLPVYNAIASKILPCDQILQSMSSVKYDIKDIMSNHSKYVDLLLMEFKQFSDLIADIENHIHIPTESANILWSKIIQTACQIFVEGFSQVKKCTNEGRALMQLDFQQFRTKLEQLSNIRPLPHHSFVEDYIKAYYLSEADLETWLTTHNEYTPKQLQALVLCGAGGHLNKKVKNKLLQLTDK